MENVVHMCYSICCSFKQNIQGNFVYFIQSHKLSQRRMIFHFRIYRKPNRCNFSCENILKLISNTLNRMTMEEKHYAKSVSVRK